MVIIHVARSRIQTELEAFFCCPYGLGPGKDGAYRMFAEVMMRKKKYT